MTTGTSCRLCWGGETESFLYLPRFPAFVERLLDSGEVASDQPVTLDVRRCNACGFIHLPFSPLPADFYRHYDKSAVNASSMKRYQNELARKIVFDHCLGKKRALEVGCGDGYFAGQLKNLGVDVTAVEPGNTSAIRTRNRGIPVIEEYFSSTLDLKPGSFNTIIARQVLSHIEDIHGFAAAAHRFLAPNGVIILEVPDVGEAMARGRYYDFFADYVNYFDGGTLVRLFSHHGFIPYEI
jgi:SAM-dependent methyltransferase